MSEELKVLVTGAAGQIAYSLLFALAKGDVFGEKQNLHLVLLDIPPMAKALDGVCMELEDCALPNLKNVTATTDVQEAFTDIDFAILVGAMPRREGMERKDLLKANVRIFKEQGKALDSFAKKSVKVLVVGNPANTNCLVAALSAPSIPRANFTCLTRLDQNRAQAQIAGRIQVANTAVKNVIIWGNHSSTQYPDVNHAVATLASGETGVVKAINNDDWLNSEFITTVQKRGAAVIAARKLSSAMSAAKAICDHLRDWHFGISEGCWTSMGTYSNGEYGVPEGIVYSFPIHISSDGSYKIVEGLSINDDSRKRMEATANELIEEKAMALEFISE